MMAFDVKLEVSDAHVASSPISSTADAPATPLREITAAELAEHEAQKRRSKGQKLPKNARGQSSYSCLKMKLSKLGIEGAKRQLDRWIENDSSNALLQRLHGEYLLESGYGLKCAADVLVRAARMVDGQEAFEKNKAHKNYIEGLAKISDGGDDAYAHAFASFQTAHICFGKDPLVHVAFGLVQLQLGQEAEGAFTKALKQSPKLVVAHLGLSDSFRNQGKWGLAQGSCSQALELCPHSYQAHLTQGFLYVEADKLKDAQTSFFSAMKLRPEASWAHFALAETSFALKEYGTAKAKYQHALFYDGTFAPAHRGLGDCLLQLGDLAGAVMSFARADGLAP